MVSIAWNGEGVVPLAQATIPLADRGHLVGDGVFETMRAHSGAIFRLDAHMERMRAGLDAIGLPPELASDCADVAAHLAQVSTDDDLYIRVQVSTGPSEELASNDGARVTGICKKFRPYPMTHYQRGIRVIRSQFTKQTQDPLASVKSLSFLPYVVARRHAMRETAHDAILFNEHGRVAEATTSNVFALHGEVLHAPGPTEGALDGITRAAVLELAADTGLEVVESLDEATLASASDVFLTNTIGGVVPVQRYQDSLIGEGKPGEFAKRMGRAMAELVRAG